MVPISDWREIKSRFTDALLIGNGASVAIDTNFNYPSLKEYAIETGHFTDEIRELFEEFDTSNFEFILKIVWQATHVNKVLKIKDKKTENTYILLRDLLIEIIQQIHPSYEAVQEELPNISRFLSGFKTVLSLNYDLIIYWAIMYGNKSNQSHQFKDCFVNNANGKLIFNSNWKKFRKSLPPKEKSTLVFYLHGNLIFGTNLNDIEEKISSRDDSNLLDTILDKWRNENLVPLFISEGIKEQKINSIYKSRYLGTTYTEVLMDSVWNLESLTIYGWSFGSNDLHILEKMFNYEKTFCKRIAVSVHESEGDNAQAYCNRVKSKITGIHALRNTDIVFFKSESEGSWNN